MRQTAWHEARNKGHRPFPKHIEGSHDAANRSYSQGFLFVVTVLAYIQVIPPFTARLLSSSQPPLTFKSTGNENPAAPFSGTYSVFTWVQFRELPTINPDSIICIRDETEGPVVDITKAPTGEYKVTLTYWNGSAKSTSETTVSGCIDKEWEHIALVVTSSTAVLQVTKWKQASASSNTITLLAAEVRIVDTQLDAWSSRQLADAVSIVSTVQCYSTCTNCNGPSDESCLNYYKLNFGVVTLTKEQFTLTQSQMIAQRWPVDPSVLTSGTTMQQMSFTGWYYEDPLATNNNLLQVKESSGYSCSIDKGSAGILLSFIGATTVILTASAPPAQKWYFVAMSLDASQLHLCVETHLKAATNCQNSSFSVALTLPISLAIGTASKPAITGKMADQRLYPTVGLTESEINGIFVKDSRPQHCSTALSPFECSVCESGYSFQPVCIRKLHTEYINGSSGCSSDPGKCSVCALSPTAETHMCRSPCPTGSSYDLSQGKCTSASAILMDFTLDKVSPKLKDQYGNEAINGAKETSYFPISIESSDPRPSSRRGYHFTSGEYLNITSASTYVQAPTITFAAWIKPTAGDNFRIYSSSELSIWVISGTMVRIWAYFQSMHMIVQSGAMLTNGWACLTLTCTYQDTAGTSDVSFYVDGVLITTYSAQEFYIKDSLSWKKGYIGGSGTAFLYQVTLRNGIWPTFPTFMQFRGRPAGTDYSLSNSPFTHTQQGDICLTKCTNGCSRPSGCNLCLDPLCLYCPNLQESYCVACKDHASWVDERCKCDMTYFHDIPSESCKPCSPLCRNCEREGANQCIDCFEHAEVVNGACECIFSAYPNPDKAHCAPCSSTCYSCQGEGPLQCLSCRANAFMKSASPSECICNPGYFPDLDPGSCTQCPSDCRLCLNENTCSECYSYTRIAEGRCKCLEGYYGNPNESNCLPCEYGCLQCSMEACIKCSPNLFILGGTCVSVCPFGYRSDQMLICQEVDVSSPIPSLSVSTNNTLLVIFNKPMNCTIESTDISVTAQVPGDLDAGIQWKDPFFQDPFILTIILLLEATYLPSGSSLTLSFLSPSLVVDTLGIPIDISTLSGPLTPFGTAPPPSLLSTSSAKQAAAASKGAVSGTAATSIINGNPAGLMSLVNQLQIVSYISMTKLEIEEDFASSLAALNVAGMIPNPVADRYSIDSDGLEAPKYIANYGISTCLFLTNSQTFLGTSAAILLAYLPIYLLSKVKVKFIAKYFKSKLQSLKWNAPLQLWLTAYLDMSIFSLLQLRNAAQSFTSVMTVTSLVVATVFAIFVVATPIALIVFFVKNWDLVASRSDKEFNRKWGGLFLPFKAEKQSAGFAYYIIFTVRRLLLAITLILLPDQLHLLALFNTFCSFLVTFTQTFMYLLVCRPYISTFDLSEAVIVEGCTFGIYSLASLFLFELSSKAKQLLGSIGAWALIATIGINSVLSLVRSVVMVVGLVKAYGERRKEIQAKYRVYGETEQISPGSMEIRT